ncbi:MAG: adenylate kinase [Verrucomicrobia bacterium]|nr:adenylate kinase [Verrucomicrobiota bacterium]
MDVLLLGAPGSGKGTLAALLVKELGIPHVATGDLFRENLKANTELGRLAKSYMDQGQLVPDDVTARMVADRMSRSDVARGFILDGFPRTLPQASALGDILAGLGRRVLAVFHMRISDEVIIARLGARLICRQCQTPYNLVTMRPRKEGICDKCGGELYQRDDDKPETVGARLKVYHTQTAPLIEHYTRAGLVHEVAADGPLDAMVRQVLDTLRSLPR